MPLLRGLPENFSAFSSDEQECISRKIRKNVDEGRSRDQAVAIAISQCAPEKARKAKDFRAYVHQLAEDLTDSGFFEDIPGGRFTARRNADGTWDILDIPIMSTVPDGARGNDGEVGKKWMAATLAQHERNESDQGHLPPIHIRHHGDDDEEKERAGFFRLTRIGTLLQNGRSKPTLYADFLRVPSSVYRRIRNLELPYRSVEIFSWEKPEIASLALLSDESPFFKMPMLTIGREVVPTPLAEHLDAEMAPVVAATVGSFSEGGGALLFNFRGSTMPSKKKTSKKPAKFDEHEDDDDKEKIQEEEDDKEKKEEMEDTKVSEAVTALQGIAPLLAEIKKVLSALQGGGEEEEESATPVEAKEETTVKASETTDPLVAKLAGEIEALKAREKNRENEFEKAAMVDAAVKELRSYNISEGTRERMFSMVKGVEDPSAILKPFVESFKATMPKEPASTLEAFENDLAGMEGTDTDEILKFGAQGPEHLEKARKYARAFKECQDHGLAFDESVTLKSFIEDQIAHEESERRRLRIAGA